MMASEWMRAHRVDREATANSPRGRFQRETCQMSLSVVGAGSHTSAALTIDFWRIEARPEVAAAHALHCPSRTMNSRIPFNNRAHVCVSFCVLHLKALYFPFFRSMAPSLMQHLFETLCLFSKSGRIFSSRFSCIFRFVRAHRSAVRSGRRFAATGASHSSRATKGNGFHERAREKKPFPALLYLARRDIFTILIGEYRSRTPRPWCRVKNIQLKSAWYVKTAACARPQERAPYVKFTSATAAHCDCPSIKKSK